jgi:large subunit ribosomal protein LP0
MGGKTANKAGYFDKLKGLLEEYRSIFIVTVDNVSSQQMHEIRHALRGEGVVLMGKNTMVRYQKSSIDYISHNFTRFAVRLKVS